MSTAEVKASAVALEPEAGEGLWFLGSLLTVKIGRQESGGRVCVIEHHCPYGFGAPWHVHSREDEWFYVLEGEFTVYVGEQRLSLPAGSFAFGPKGVPHTFIAETDGAKALIGFQPFHFEGFLREAAEPATEPVLPPRPDAPPDMERLLPIAARNGMQILGPPGPPPGH
jgi:quercetin dioxygenase-like cupin family protein